MRPMIHRRTLLLSAPLWAIAPHARAAAPSVEVFKDPNCGCCTDWVKHMNANGFATRVHDEGNGNATAFTIVQASGQDPLRVDWIIDTVDNSFHVRDLRVEGLSIADTHRQEFASVIQNNGGDVQKLIDILHQKAKL